MMKTGDTTELELKQQIKQLERSAKLIKSTGSSSSSPGTWIPYPSTWFPSESKLSKQLIEQLHARLRQALAEGKSDKEIAEIYAESFKYVLDALKKEKELTFL